MVRDDADLPDAAENAPLGAVLDDLGVEHGLLSRAVRSRRLWAEDGSRVRCKAGTRAELGRELTVAAQLPADTRVVSPLLDDLLEAEGSTWSVWPWFAYQRNFHATVDATTALRAATALAAAHRVSPTGLPLVQTRVDAATEKLSGVDPTLRRALSTALACAVRPMHALDQSSPRRLCHGSAKISAYLTTPDGGRWTSWERALATNPSFDVASMRHHLLRVGGNRSAWEAVWALFEGHELVSEYAVGVYENFIAVEDAINVALSSAPSVAFARAGEVHLIAEGMTLPDRLTSVPEATY